MLGLNEGDRLFHSIVVHNRDSAAVQWEECFVNPYLVPAYLKQNYSRVTPQAYLNWATAATRVEHQVQAVMPDAEITGALGLPAISSCLKVSRRNWRGDKVVSICKLIYPGSYSLGAELII
jgi:GntR family histidine utilization transcriptional repressor